MAEIDDLADERPLLPADLLAEFGYGREQRARSEVQGVEVQGSVGSGWPDGGGGHIDAQKEKSIC